jgi:hypothetical protein
MPRRNAATPAARGLVTGERQVAAKQRCGDLSQRARRTPNGRSLRKGGARTVATRSNCTTVSPRRLNRRQAASQPLLRQPQVAPCLHAQVEFGRAAAEPRKAQRHLGGDYSLAEQNGVQRLARNPIWLAASEIDSRRCSSRISRNNSLGCVGGRLSGRRTGSSVLGFLVIALAFNGTAPNRRAVLCRLRRKYEVIVIDQ